METSTLKYDNFTAETETPSILAYNQYVESKVALAVLRYYSPVIIFIGTLGNMMAFAILMRKSMRRTSIYVYLAVLAWADTAVLYLSAFKTWIRLITGYELLHVSEISCKVLTHLFVVSLHMAAWLIVAMSVDRLIAVLTPFKAVSWCSPKRARIVSLMMLLLFILIHIHIFWKFELISDQGRFQCAGSIDDHFIIEVFPWLRLVTYSIIPFGIVIIINIIIIAKLCKQHSSIKQARNANQNRVGTGSTLQQQKLTVMLLSVSFVWLALSAPFTIWRLALPGYQTNDQHHRAKVFLARIICFNLMWLNHSINFALYCLTGKKFRRECVEFMHFLTKNKFRRVYIRSTRTTDQKSTSLL